MSLKVTFQERSKYLFAEFDGEWTEEAMTKALDATREKADKQGMTKLLFDGLKVSEPANEMTRFYSGEHLAKVLGRPFKISVFTRKEIYNQFGENVARNRGANIMVFFDEDEALEWLFRT